MNMRKTRKGRKKEEESKLKGIYGSLELISHQSVDEAITPSMPDHSSSSSMPLLLDFFVTISRK